MVHFAVFGETDLNNIFWHGGMGYQVDIDAALIGEGFQQGAPLLAIRPGDKDIDVKQLFQSFSDGMFDTVGDYDGLLCVGMSLLYAAAQKVYRDYGGRTITVNHLWLEIPSLQPIAVSDTDEIYR